jgi:hypothetical protein
MRNEDVLFSNCTAPPLVHSMSLRISYKFTNAIKCSMLVPVPASDDSLNTPYKKELHLT